MINVNNKTFRIRQTPLISDDKRIVVDFISGGTQWREIDLSYDSDTGHYYIYYLNLQGSVLAYETTVGWELEYRYLTFLNNSNIDDADWNDFIGTFEQYLSNGKRKIGNKNIVKRKIGNKNVLKEVVNCSVVY